MTVVKRKPLRIATDELNMMNWCANMFGCTKVSIIDRAETAYRNGMHVSETRKLKSTTTTGPVQHSGNLKPLEMRRVLLTYMERELTEFFGGELPEIPKFEKEKD